MTDIENVYNELHHLVRHGQKQGFIAGVIFSAGVLAASKVRQNKQLRAQVRRTHVTD